MKKRILLWLGVVALAVMAVLIGVVGLQPAPELVQSFQMANGDVVTLIDVTYGTNGLVWAKPYQKTLYRLLPQRFKSLAGGTRISANFGLNPTNRPIFWIHDTRRQPRTNEFNVRLVDEYGWEYDPNGYTMGSTYLPKGGVVAYFSVDAGVPHGEAAGIAIFESQARTNHLGTFYLPGRSKPESPAGATAAIPTQSAGDLKFELTALRTGFKSAPYPVGPQARDAGIFSQAAFRVTRNGRPDTSWTPSRVEVTGPGGTLARSRGTAVARRGDEVAWNFDGKFEPAVGPWKLRVEFVQQRDFAEEALGEFREVPFPAPSEVLEPGLKTNMNGGTVTLVKVYGSGSERPSSIPAWLAGRPFVELLLSPVTNTAHFRWLGAVDDRGNSITYSSTTGGFGRNFGIFQQNATAKTVDIKFAVHHSRFVEFEAAAELWNTNAPVSRH